MLANDTLITADEIIDYGPADSEMDSSIFEPYIIMQEEKLFRDCIGMDIYKSMLEDKSGITTTTYFNGGEHAEGDIVIYADTFYEAIRDVPEFTEPINPLYWKRAAKFTNESYNFLWERYLRRLLAMFITESAIINIANRIKARGVLKPTGGDSGSGFSPEEPISHKELISLKNSISDDAWDLWRSMNEWVLENKAHFPGYLPASSGEGCSCFGKANGAKLYGFNLG